MARDLNPGPAEYKIRLLTKNNINNLKILIHFSVLQQVSSWRKKEKISSGDAYYGGARGSVVG
jgi:hypothetical protein